MNLKTLARLDPMPVRQERRASFRKGTAARGDEQWITSHQQRSSLWLPNQDAVTFDGYAPPDDHWGAFAWRLLRTTPNNLACAWINRSWAY